MGHKLCLPEKGYKLNYHVPFTMTGILLSSAKQKFVQQYLLLSSSMKFDPWEVHR